MKLIRLIFSIIALSVFSFANATSYSISGKVMENDGEAISYATVKIFNSTDSIKPVFTGVTKNNGTFTATLKSAGDYIVNIIAVGKTAYSNTVHLTEENPKADIGTIALEDADNELAEITVTATKPLISMEVDRIGYDVQADEESKTAMTDEILRKVPLVSVDPDGTIKVNGNSNFKIYKNGRPNNAFSNNAKDLFKSLPASMIEKIEVITEPGAREDAEGSSVILNIITLKTTVIKGAMGNIGLNYSTPAYVPNPSLWFSAQYDKFTMSLYGGLMNSNRKQGKQYETSETHYLDTDNVLTSDSHISSHGPSGYFGLEASLEPDTLNLFTFDFGGFLMGRQYESHGFQNMEDALGNLIYRYNSSYRTLTNRYHSLYGSANYQRSTSRKGESLILSYRVYSNKNHSENETEYSDYVNLPVPYTGIYSDNDENGIEHTVQFDWTRPINQSNTFDIGAKYIYRDNHSESVREYYDWMTNESDFKHTTQIGALFGDYRLNIGKFGARAGVRYEFSRLSAKYPSGGGKDFHANLNDWVPNVGLVYNPNTKNSLRLNFGSRIQRPGINYLNPMVNESPTTTSQGNPDLESVRYNSLSLSYSLMLPKFMASVSLSYNFANNNIIQTQYTEGDHTYLTFGNTGKVRSFSPYAYFNWRPSPKTSVMGSVSFFYNYTKNTGLDQEGGGWGFNVFGRVAQQLPWKMTLSLYTTAYRESPKLYTRGHIRGWSNIYYNIGLQRSFLPGDRLTVNLTLSDPFHYSRPGYYDITQTANYYNRTEYYRYYRTKLQIGVFFRFGSMRASVKKVRSISNDDVVGGNSQE